MQPWIWKPPKSENTGKNGFGMTVTERDWAWRKLKTILKNSTYRKISVTERDGGSQWKFRWFQAVPEIFNSSLSTYPQKMDWLYVSPFVFPHFVWDVSHILVQLLVLLPGYSGPLVRRFPWSMSAIEEEMRKAPHVGMEPCFFAWGYQVFRFNDMVQSINIYWYTLWGN